MRQEEDLSECHSNKEKRGGDTFLRWHRLRRGTRRKCISPLLFKKNIAYLGIGSNLGNRLKNCETAISKLNAHPQIRVTQISSWLETDPVGFTDQPKFINGAVEIETSLSPVELLNALQKIEKEMGRKPTFRWGPRVIDLDLLLYDSLTLYTEELTLPHPRIKEREFVKIPLLEINPTLKDLIFSKA